MADYINRDSVIELSREYYSQGLKEEAVPVRTIKNIPSADVAEVVRCKDCIYWQKPQVKLKDGKYRDYTEEETKAGEIQKQKTL